MIHSDHFIILYYLPICHFNSHFPILPSISSKTFDFIAFIILYYIYLMNILTSTMYKVASK